jgi:hypothetical protein
MGYAGRRAFRGDEFSSEEEIRRLLLACRTALDLWDDSWFVLSARPVQLARDAGALAVLPLALSLQAGTHIFSGHFATAEALCEEAHAVSDAIANPDAPYARLVLAAWRGQREETVRLTAAGDRDATARGEGERSASASTRLPCSTTAWAGTRRRSPRRSRPPSTHTPRGGATGDWWS